MMSSLEGRPTRKVGRFAEMAEQGASGVVTIYAPDGTPHRCASIVAEEILDNEALGYTIEPPAGKVAFQAEPVAPAEVALPPGMTRLEVPGGETLVLADNPAPPPRQRQRRTALDD